MSKFELKPGDYVRIEGIGVQQHEELEHAFIAAGCIEGDFVDISNWGVHDFMGWSPDDGGLHSDDPIDFGGRELTIAQILGTEPDADGWIEWRGGECPVGKEALVDIQLRSGDSFTGRRAGNYRWYRASNDYDIACYRLRQPEQEEVPMTIEQLLAKANKHAAKAAKHEAKRQALVEQARALMPEGWRLEDSGLIVQPAEDMTDPANWKAGDVVECIKSSSRVGARESFVSGNEYTVGRDYDGDHFLSLVADEYGEPNGLTPCAFRWISRPQQANKSEGESE